MKTVFIMRHAKSDWSQDGTPDHDRPLNQRGLRDAPRMGTLLATLGVTVDLVVSSTATRARTTAEAVVASAQWKIPIHLNQELYLAPPDTWIEALQNLPDSCKNILLVGHNPGMTELVTVLTGETVSMATAAIAEVSLSLPNWSELNVRRQHELIEHYYPKGLPAAVDTNE